MAFEVHPVLVWDDGEHLAPGPQIQPVTVPAGELGDFPDRWAANFADLRERAEHEAPDTAPDPGR